MGPLEVDYSNSFFLHAFNRSLQPLFVSYKRIGKSSQVCAQVKKTQIHWDSNHQHPDLIHDTLDHRTQCPATKKLYDFERPGANPMKLFYALRVENKVPKIPVLSLIR